MQGLFAPADYPDLLVGLGDADGKAAADDAAVWRLDDTRALVITTDFFTPVVDDGYAYGAIAAANALSDVYAMGGQPFLALNIAALPPDLPTEISGAILRGGAEKCRQAGVVVAGGHTIQDKEPKFGLVVIGMADPHRLLTKGGIQPGDKLVLSKPLGFGTTTTALKRGIAAPADVAEAVGWMTTLNKTASELAVAAGLHAATDITGFSLLGHACEMAQASGVSLRFDFSAIPFISCARKYAADFIFPGGAADNRLYFGQFAQFAPEIDEASQMLLFDPQTSGGLLMAVPPAKLPSLQQRAAACQQPLWVIGEAEKQANGCRMKISG
jgi:selenide,water dikinase